MSTINQTLLSSLYETPVAAAPQVEACCDDRLVAYLLRSELDDGSPIDLASVESVPSIPPRA